MSDLATDPRDRVLDAACPLRSAPRYTAHQQTPAGAKCIIAAADGLYIEAASGALRVRQRIAALPLPYGPLAPSVELVHGPVPRDLFAQFIRRACESPDREVAAAIVATSSGYELHWPNVLSSSAGHVRFIDDIDDEESIVVDLHSHGRHRAFFSPTDDQSDLTRRGPLLAMVVGRCGAEPEIAARFVMPPHLIQCGVADLSRLGVFR
jgi:PRTRC genetic system protein A